jgi:hypothetical protein
MGPHPHREKGDQFPLLLLDTTIQISGMAKVNLHVIECFLCRNLIEVRPPSKQYELILNEPCPVCNGLAQSIDCDNCLQNITIYWDERHFASH